MAEMQQSVAGGVGNGGGVNISLATSTGFIVSAIIVAVIIFVFVFYRCLLAHQCWGANPVSFGNHVPAAFAAEQRPSAGLDVASIKALPAKIFRPEEFKGVATECCAVCLCELVAGEAARLLPNCNHAFHVKCIDMWFYSHSTCPLCRTPAAIHHKFSEDAGAGGAKARPVEPLPNSLSSMQPGSSSSSSGRSLENATVARTPRRRPGEVVQTPSSPPLVEEIMSPLTSLRRLLRPVSRVVVDASAPRDIEQGCVPKSPMSFANDRFT